MTSVTPLLSGINQKNPSTQHTTSNNMSLKTVAGQILHALRETGPQNPTSLAKRVSFIGFLQREVHKKANKLATQILGIFTPKTITLNTVTCAAIDAIKKSLSDSRANRMLTLDRSIHASRNEPSYPVES